MAALAEASAAPVHLRLLIDPRADARYPAICWETLLDPERGSRLTLNEGVRFSRHLNSPSWTQVALKPDDPVLFGLEADDLHFGLGSAAAPVLARPVIDEDGLVDLDPVDFDPVAVG